MLQVDRLKQGVGYKAHSDNTLLITDGTGAFIPKIFCSIYKIVSQEVNKKNIMGFLSFSYELY